MSIQGSLDSAEVQTRRSLIAQLCTALIAQSPPPDDDKQRVTWRRDLVAEASQIADMVLANDGSALPRPLMLPATVADCLHPAVKGEPDPSWTLGADAYGRALRDSWDAEHPHLLVGGSAGSGKSTVMDVALCQMLHNNHPDDLTVWLVGGAQRFLTYWDVAHVERALNISSGMAEFQDIADLLADAVAEMEARYAAMSAHPSMPATLSEAAALAVDAPDLPSSRLLIVIEECSNYFHRPCRDDELGMEVWRSIIRDVERITRESRSAGIHLMMATQHAVPENVPATIKAQCRRIGLRTRTAQASRVILGRAGLESVSEPGSGFYDRRADCDPVAFQGFYLSPTGRDSILARLPRHPDS